VTDRRRTRPAVALLALSLSPVWTGCYRTVSTTTGDLEDVVRREIQSQPPRVDVEAVRDGVTGLALTASERKMCRTRIFGTATPYRDLALEKDEEKTKKIGLGIAVASGVSLLGGLGLMSAGQDKEPWRPKSLWTPEDRAAQEEADKYYRYANVSMVSGIVLILVAAGVLYLPAAKKVDRQLGETRRLDRFDGEPFICEGTPRTPLPDVPILSRVAFTETRSTLDLPAITGKDGTARLDLEPVLLTAGHCGEATLAAATATDARLPRDATLGPGASLTLAALRSEGSLATLAQRDMAAATVASLCCTRRVVESSAEECEERCARAGMVQKCLFARRACVMKADRAEDEPEKARALCKPLYEECLVANGTTSRNLQACIDGCGGQRAAETCR